MMQAIVKACLAVSITMGALMAGTASGQAPSSVSSDEAVPMATCDPDACDTLCVQAGNCEGRCTAAGVCRCVRRTPSGCP